MSDNLANQMRDLGVVPVAASPVLPKAETAPTIEELVDAFEMLVHGRARFLFSDRREAIVEQNYVDESRAALLSAVASLRKERDDFRMSDEVNDALHQRLEEVERIAVERGQTIDTLRSELAAREAVIEAAKDAVHAYDNGASGAFGAMVDLSNALDDLAARSTPESTDTPEKSS